MQRKKQGGIPANNPELMSSQLMAKGVRVQEFEVDINDYKNYFNQSRYLEDYPEYYSGNLPEKSLEHYIASKLLGLSPDDIYIDVASESGVVPKIYHQVFGCQTYAQDLEYPPGLNGNSIGGDAGDMPIPNDFATKIGLHCSIEHFEGDADIRFAKELRRVLKFGGKCCIAPLYLFHEYAIQTDPVAATATGWVTFESDAIIYEHLGWNNRHGRFYDPEHLVSRIINNLNGFNITIYRIKNAKQVDNSCYIQFAAVLEKPLDDNTLGLDQHTTKINSSPNSSQHKSSLSHPVKKTVGKPNHFSSISTQPRIDVVLQATGTHGWNCSRGWVNVLQRQGLLNRVFTPMAEWGESGSTNDDGLYEYLRNPDADIMILLGFDWHSHPLHNNLKWREQWCNANIKKVAIFQEHCSADIVQNTPQWQEQISIAIDNAATCVSAIICNHEPDVSWLLNRGIKTPTVFSPFAIDPQYYNCQIPFTQRKNRAVFRGNATPHFNNKTYYQRSQLMDRLKPNHHVDLYPLVTDLLSKPLEAVQSYVDELNTYKLGLNLPSLSPTLTSRPYEIMGCGTLLLQNHVIGDKSNKLFRDWEHLVYYNPENPDDLIEKIEYLLKNPDLAEEIADRGYHLCQEKHTIECRVKELIEWTDSDFQVSENTPTISDATGQVILKSEGLSKTVNLHRQIKNSLLVAVDAVFFQLNDTGIARVWKHLLDEWAKDGFAKNILVIDRAGTAPKFSGFRYRRIPEYNYNDTDRDRQILQQVCDEEGVNIFISTYYTTPLSTPSVFMGYDMIPELIAQNLDDSMCQEKHQGIRHASAYLTISENTKRDLVGCFPNILVDSITVAHCGIDSNFTPASQEEIIEFTSKYEIRKPYFLVVGDRVGWRNTGYKNGILFFKAFAQLTDKHDFEIVCTGGDPAIEDKFLHYASGVKIHRLYLTDEDLRVAYSGAVALVYPSLYEGFGMPVLEAMACGCPVITCPYASLPEVGGNAVLYVSGRDVNEMAEAMIKVQQPEVRESLIRLGLEQSKQFSWSKMAEIVKSVLIETATDSLDNNSVELVRLPQEKSTSKDSNQEVLVVTSIAPRNIERQQACINTWQSLGFSVVSLNIQEEINQLQSLFPNVRFHAVWRDARTETERPLVYVEDIFMYLRGNGTKISGIINSDIYLNVDAGFVSFIAKEAIDNMVFGSRMDIDSLEDYQDGVLYDKGFDYFFFDKNLLEHYPPENFCMGMPWWDYWIPLVLLEKGIPIKLLISPIAYHVKHLMNFSEHRWIKFASYIASYYQSSSNYQQFFLQREFIDEGQEHQRLMNGCHELANKILQKIYQESSRICYFQDQIEDNFSQEVVSKPVTVFPENLRNNSQFLVSAIISTYNSEKYIRGCLQDLVEQTLYKQGKLQIVIVDSASPQNEQSIVKEFQAKYANIVYERTPERETLYAAWNRAIKMSHGKYITNANTDDRHRFDALEVMANFLDTHPEVSLAYPNQLITTVPNDTFVTTQGNRHWNWPPYSYEQMKQGCCLGSQPMWRKSLHDKYGYFRSEFHCAGDYEFWLRIGSQGEKLALIPEILGLYYFNPQGIEHGTPGRAGQETDQICDEYGIKRLYIPNISGSERKFEDLQYQGALLTDEEKANLLHYQQLAVNYQNDGGIDVQTDNYKVSAIVSTYNSEKFIRGRLENLVNQTLYTQDQLEIIVIDSNSEQNEGSIVKEFQNKYPHIIYERTPNRETIYAAWNRGIKMCHSQYVINANADDRFATNALEIMANKLDNDSHLSAVYGDWLITPVENDSFDSNSEKFNFSYPEFIPPLLLYYQITTHAALIKKSVFDQIGYYRDEMKVFGDREFMLRFSANGLMAKKIPDIVGLYYENPNSISMGEVGYAALENEYEPLRQEYLELEILSKLFGYNSLLDQSKLAQLYAVLGSWGKEFFVWNGQSVSDINFAEKVFCKALELDQTNSLALNNLGIIRATQGNYQQATEMLNLALQYSNNDQQNIPNNIAAVNNQCNTFADYFWVKPSMPMFVPTSQLTNSSTLKKPLVSVIIPTKDRPEMLAQAIQSVLNQTFTELEIIVVNDGGVDVQSVISRLNTRGNIVYKKHDHTLERSAARNTGIRAARGKYIAYLDDDDNYYPNHIETLVKFLENSEYKIAYTDAVMAQQEKQNGQYITVHRSQPYSSDFDNDKILVNNFIPILCVMHEKSCLDQIGLFDETLTTHEDWDVWIRLSRHFQFAHIPQATCEFTRREDGTTTTSKNRADFIRTREIIYDKYWQYAENNPEILVAQQSVFKSEAKELATSLAQTQEKLAQAQLEQEKLTTHVEMNQEKIRQIENQSQQIQEEKQWLEAQLSSWKQTALQLQIELQQTENHRETSKI